MSLDENIVSEVIKDGIKITTYKDGSQHFEALRPLSFWQKIKNWFNNTDIKPYVKIRDLADPFGDRKNNPDDIDAGLDGKSSIEAGIKIDF